MIFVGLITLIEFVQNKFHCNFRDQWSVSSFWKVFIKFCWHVKNLQQWRQQLLPILPICQPMFFWILMAFIHIPLFLHPCVLSLLTFLLLLSRSMKSLLKDSRVKETHPPTTKALYMTEWEIRIHLQVPVYNIKVIWWH